MSEFPARPLAPPLVNLQAIEARIAAWESPGATHWEGCAESHPLCALRQVIVALRETRAALRRQTRWHVELWHVELWKHGDAPLVPIDYAEQDARAVLSRVSDSEEETA